MAKAKKKVVKKSRPAAKKVKAVKKAKPAAKPVKKAKKAAPKAAKKIAKKSVQKTTPVKQAKVANAAPSKPRASLEKIISPLDDRLLLRLDEGGERTTPGGLILLEGSEAQGHRRGAVIAVGRGHRDKKGRVRPLELKVGDRVLVPEYAGSKVKISDEELVIVRESEVVGLLDT